MDFSDHNQFAKTSGGPNLAQNEYTTQDQPGFESLVVSIQNQGNQYLLLVKNKYVENSQVIGSCFYQATLTKK